MTESLPRPREEDLVRLFEAAPAPLVLTRHSDSTILMVNRAVALTFEVDPREIVGQPATAFYAHPDDRRRFLEALARDGRVDGMEMEMRTGTGRTVWASVSASTIDYRGERAILIGAADLTGRAEAARALRESEERFRALSENAPIGVFRQDLEGRCLYTNPRWSEITGLPAEEALGPGWARVVHPDDLAGAAAAFAEAKARGERYRLEIRVTRPTRDVRWVSILSGPVLGGEGTVTGYVGTIDDITERKRAEEALRASERMLRQVLDTIPVRVFWKDRHCVYLGANDLTARDAGLQSAGDIVGLTDYDLGYPEAAAFQADDQRVMETGRPKLNYEEPVTAASGRVIWARTSKFPLRGPAGDVVGVLGTFEDITERKEVQERHRLLAERLSLATQAAAIGTWELEVEGEILDADEQFVALFGGLGDSRSAQDLWTERLHPEDRAASGERRRRALAGETPSYDDEVRVVWPDGSLHYLRHLGRLVRDEQSRPRRFLGVTMDVTAARQAQEDAHRLNAELERRVAERTAQLTAANRELESFSYSVSHDLRAPLRAIDGFSQALVEDYGDRLDENSLGHLRRVRQASQRMGQLIDDILELSRTARAELRRRRISLTSLAEGIVAQLRAAHPERVVEVVIEPGLEAEADESLSRVLLENLLGNAWKYTSKKAAARIELGRAVRDDGAPFFVRDDGDGFDMAYAHKLFGAFQRLHGMDEFEGTGIGLATVRRIVDRHGGKVWGEGRPGAGAAFYFTLGESVAGP